MAGHYLYLLSVATGQTHVEGCLAFAENSRIHCRPCHGWDRQRQNQYRPERAAARPDQKASLRWRGGSSVACLAGIPALAAYGQPRQETPPIQPDRGHAHPTSQYPQNSQNPASSSHIINRRLPPCPQPIPIGQPLFYLSLKPTLYGLINCGSLQRIRKTVLP